jgi:hypothetical protein
MSSQSYCDLSGFKFLTFAQKQEYQRAWQIFNNVQAFNSNISTLRFTGNISTMQMSTFQQGNSNLTYYQFISGEEKTKFLQGRFLHIQSYPNSNWDFVEQN